MYTAFLQQKSISEWLFSLVTSIRGSEKMTLPTINQHKNSM